jgi:hypothetical protein
MRGGGLRLIHIAAGRDDRARLLVGAAVRNETITEFWAILVADSVGPIVQPYAKPVVVHNGRRDAEVVSASEVVVVPVFLLQRR